MPFIIALLIVIVLVLCFGPLAGMFAGVAAAMGLAVWGLALLLVPILGFGAVVVGTIAWCIWWCFDPKAAMAEYRAAQDRSN